jgi:hypothetical protein
MRLSHVLVTALLLVASPLLAREWKVPAATGIIGVEVEQLDPQYWIQRQAHADRVVLDAAAIAEQNARLHARDRSLHDLATLPAALTREQVAAWLQPLSARPDKPLYDVEGQPIATATLDAVIDNASPGTIPAQQDTRYGLVVHRADLRTFPTALRVFTAKDDHDIDRFQESALFPGDPVAIVHESRDGAWWFVVNTRYAAWIEKRWVAEGAKDAVLGYARKTPYRIVTGAKVRTLFTPEEPAVSELQLDMGVRVPLLAEWPQDQPVNGQHAYTSYVIELPVRNRDGALRFAPALLPRREPSSADYLALTRRNLTGQSFRFLGERYGWGHDYNGRDCSGFVSEIYRSMGVELPRNTGDQAVSPALNRIVFKETDDRAKRLAIVHELQVGDLVYIPGHVMMVIGQVDGEPYVIHDTAGLSWRSGDGTAVRAKTNGVTVSPLTPLMFDDTQTYVDRITNIQRIRP